MRRWGILVTSFYVLLLGGLVLPLAGRLAGASWREIYPEIYSLESGLHPWFVFGLFVLGEALLLLTTVDTSWKRVTPRQHIAVSAATAGLFIALLSLAALSSIWFSFPEATRPADDLSPFSDSVSVSWTWILGLWAAWGTVFYTYYRASPGRLSRVVSVLLRASVLELLIAVPAHVVVRRRNECSAPFVTAFGICTGIAVMLACFGPGVLALYAKRVRERSSRHIDASHPAPLR